MIRPINSHVVTFILNSIAIKITGALHFNNEWRIIHINYQGTEWRRYTYNGEDIPINYQGAEWGFTQKKTCNNELTTQP
jgi:hypothetical protein